MLTRFQSGNLFITGDDGPNNITVERAGAQVTIVGNGTVVRGPTTGNVSGGITIDLRGGADRVQVAGDSDGTFTLRKLTILAGAGADHVTLSQVEVTEELRVETESGNDHISFDQFRAATVNIFSGADDDEILLSGLYSPDSAFVSTSINNLTIDSGAGNDQVTLFNTNVTGTTQIETAAGADRFELRGNFPAPPVLNRLEINTGDDADTVVFNQMQADNLKLSTGAGDDRVLLGGDTGRARFNESVLIETGEGADEITAREMAIIHEPSGSGLYPNYNEFFGPVTFLTAGGDDKLLLDLCVFAASLDLEMGAGADSAVIGVVSGFNVLYKPLRFEGPTTFVMGGENDTINLGAVGVPFTTVAFDGPLTIRGGSQRTNLYRNVASVEFNDTVALSDVHVFDLLTDKENRLAAPQVTVKSGQTANFSARTNQSFVTEFSGTAGAGGQTLIQPVLTTISTGISLEATPTFTLGDEGAAVISLDLRLVMQALVSPPAETTVHTPLGRQTVQRPRVATIDKEFHGFVDDGGSLFVEGLEQAVTDYQGRVDGLPLTDAATTRRLMLVRAGTLLVSEDPSDIAVYVEVKLFELIDRNPSAGLPNAAAIPGLAPPPKVTDPTTLVVSTLAAESGLPTGGTVSSTFKNGSLLLTGDNRANEITVRLVNGKVVIAGQNGTAVRGVTSGEVTGDISLDLGDGADQVIVAGEVQRLLKIRNLKILTGAGGDRVTVENVVVRGRIDIDTAGGDDEVTLTGPLTAGAMGITTGAQNDLIHLVGAYVDPLDVVLSILSPIHIAGPLNIDSGDGNDQVECYVVDVDGDTRVNTGAGRDSVRLAGSLPTDSRFNGLRIDTGADADSVEFTVVRVNQLRLETRDGDDFIYLGRFEGRARFDGPVWIDTGAGADYITALPGIVFPSDTPWNQFHGPVNILTGGASDSIQLDLCVFDGPLNINFGAGRDDLRIGIFSPPGFLVFGGPVTLNMGNQFDNLYFGVLGADNGSGADVATSSFNGPLTIIGGTRQTKLYRAIPSSEFNSRVRLQGVQTINVLRDQTEDLKTIQVVTPDGVRGTSSELTSQTFQTDVEFSPGNGGTFVARPITTTLETGITLEVTPVVSPDQRYVTLDVHLSQRFVADPIPTYSVQLPGGDHILQQPVLTRLDGRTKQLVPDGGSMSLGRLRVSTESRRDRASDLPLVRRSLTEFDLFLTPRIEIPETGPMIVTVEATIRRSEDRNAVASGDFDSFT